MVKKSVLKRKVLYYLSIFVLTSPAAGFADELGQDALLDEIVVTANRTETPKQQVTSTVSVITREMIEGSTATTLPELLTMVPGVALYNNGGMGSKAGLSIRGLDGGSSSYRTLLLIDGRPANNGFQAAIDWNTIPLVDIERIEVVRGPVSAIYGDSSLGGAVNIITKKYDKDRTVFETSYGSHDTIGTSLLQQGKLQNGNYVVTANYGKTDGFRDHRDYEGENYTLRLNLDSGWTFAGGYTQYDRTNPGTVGAQPTGPEYARPDFDTVEGFNFDLSKEIKSGIHTTKVSAYYNELNSSTITQTFDKKKKVYIDEWDLNSKLKEKTQGIQLNQNILISNKQTFNWGFDYKWLKADGVSYDKDNKTVGWPNPPTTLSPVSANEYAVYALSSRRIGEKLIMDIGGRFDHHSAFGGQFNPKFGLSYSAGNDTTLKLNIARAFRAPTLNDLYGKNSWPDLQPERAWSYELSAEKKFNTKTTGSITFYREDIEDLIVGKDRSLSGHKDNAEKMRAQGVELELTREINEHVNAYANYTYLDVGDMTRRASRHKGNFGINYQNGAFKASLFEQYVGSSYVDDLASEPDAVKLGGYALTSVKFTYEPKESGYTYSFAINNLFDKDYEKYRYCPMPGCEYTFSVKRTF